MRTHLRHPESLLDSLCGIGNAGPITVADDLEAVDCPFVGTLR